MVEQNVPRGDADADDTREFAKERRAFRFRTLTNPNYFGNLGETAQQPPIKIIGNTFCERLVCLRYHPQQRRLEGVVHIFQPSGYGTRCLRTGTPETCASISPTTMARPGWTRG